MKYLSLILVFGFQLSHATIDSVDLDAQVKSFDYKTVTLDIAGESYKFSREKLGKGFKNLAVGDHVKIVLEKTDLAAPAKPAK